jgi:flagellar hook protein FlgE
MMGSLFVGASGMKGYSQGMQVVTNNLSNQNTVGFKSAMMLYSDLTSQSVNTHSNGITNWSQRGCGVAVATNRTDFSQGAFEVGSSVTDIGINGGGYFGVQKDGVTHYTRAGNFRFDKEGNLLDPNAWGLLGRPIKDGVIVAQSEPIKLDLSETGSLAASKPKATGEIKIFSHLGGMSDSTTDSANPFFSLASKWDGTAKPPLSAGDAGFTEPVTVYDDTGKAHTLNIRYDYVGMQNGVKVYEYVVGIDPSEDGSGTAGAKAAGLLMAGTMSFSSNGKMVGLTSFTPTGSDPADLGAWTQAQLVDGVPSFTANFAGSTAPQTIRLDFGLSMDDGWNPDIVSPEAGASNPGAFYGKTGGATLKQSSTDSYGTSPVSNNQSQDGYGTGSLSDLVINDKGVVQARYSNGQSEDLYQIVLYRFNSQDGLRHEGMNHYSATQESGPAEEGLPSVENYGKIVSSHIEQSNVDTAREMTSMIITQRAFQMNSKVVTTSDQMLQKALELKR